MVDNNGDDDGELSVLGLLFTIGSLCCSILGCILTCRTKCSSMRANKNNRSDDDGAARDSLRAPLVSQATAEHNNRVDASFRHVAEGVNKCAFCGFENLRRFLFCRLCTSTLKRPSTTTESANAEYEQLFVKESKRPLQTFNVRQRKVRAKLRNEWRRKLDMEGDLFWFRDDVGGFNASAMRFPGYALRFESHMDDHGLKLAQIPVNTSTASKSKVVIETPLSKDQVVEQLSFEVVCATVQLTESVRANPALIPVSDGHHGGLQWRQVLELAKQGFLTKYAAFATTAGALLVPAHEQLLRLTISRATLLVDSMESLAVIPRGSIRSALHVSFIGNYNSEKSASKRYEEWFTFVTHQLAEPVFGVFRAITNTEQTFYLNANSLHDIGEDHLMYYFATGRLLGRALLEGRALGFHLTLPLLKIILGLPVSFNDLEYVDPEGYKSLLALLVNEGAEAKNLRFSVEEQISNADDDKVKHVVDLIPDGRNVQVTDLNKDEYLNRQFRYTLFESVSSQLYVFLKGLYEVIPQELLMLFDPEEFDYLLCGSDEINVVAWKRKRQNRQRSLSLDGIEDVIEGAEYALDITSAILDL